MNYVKSDVNESVYISFYLSFHAIAVCLLQLFSNIHRAFLTSLNTKYLFWHLFFLFFVALPFTFYAEFASEFE